METAFVLIVVGLIAFGLGFWLGVNTSFKN